MDIGNKLFTLVIKGFEKERFLAVPTANIDPSISDSYWPGIVHDIECQLGFGFGYDAFRSTGSFATILVICPLSFGKYIR